MAGSTGTHKGIGIVLFDDVEELDAGGPRGVLAGWTTAFPDDGWRVITLSPDGQAVRCAKGLRITPDHGFEGAPHLDVVLHPGGQGTRPQLRDEGHLAWVRGQAASAELMTSV